jgi:heterodisulfide reductase subunit B
MCQMNLEAYQDKVAQRYGGPGPVTILYLPQFLGLAMGLSDDTLGIGLNLALSPDFSRKRQTAVTA